ncbi:hypothetical protein [Dyadobacter sp. CY323]|uniref:hypothetical protein n=1 Tax=Dyadobacter sp. CY323 TaxID=2907302 RepID=UPI001F1AAF59|nr:hypothetical protein [Dyadobacter sp. CY323]MCE6992427.1 hypothetical protein [Dyadobacter sp. CY323]
MKRRFYYFTFLFLLIQLLSSVELSAQGKLVEGYIITNTKDTIRGLVRDEGWMESPALIRFKAANEPEEVEFFTKDIQAFGMETAKSIYKSKRIGLLNISLDQIYKTAPSLQTRDSVGLFLQEIVAGEKATLYEYVNAAEQSHYFVEKNNQLTELYNYPFYKEVDNKKYLLTYDEYKRQLAEMSRDAPKFKTPVPAYQEKHLKQYIEKYNQSFSDISTIYKAEDNGLTYDLDFNAGFENWNGNALNIKNKFTYGVGIRVNLPRRFQNRYLKFNIFLTPNVLISYDRNYTEETFLKTFEVAFGSYMGSSKIRPYLGFHYSGVYQNHREMFLGMQGGISYNRRINLEIGHFANFYSVFSESGFFTAPRISLHYFLDLNKVVAGLKRKK